jgi:hypothetical protein
MIAMTTAEQFINAQVESDEPAPTPVIRRVGVMWDTESLGLPANSMVRELAFIAFDLDDPETTIKEVEEFFPLEVQEDLNRPISISTVAWLLDQPKDVQQGIKANIKGDFDELQALVRSIGRKYRQVIESANEVENWFARPQHDVPMIESLFRACGEPLPWHYSTVNDLRTLMNQAGIPIRSPELESLKKGLILHTARGDCLFQIRCYAEARRRLVRTAI